MIIEKLISLLESQADSLSESWIQLLKENENTAAYQNLDDESLSQYSHFVYQQLKLWLDWQITSAEVAKLFWQVGVERKAQQVPLSDIYYAVVLARRNLFINILEKLGADEKVDMVELIAFTSRITYFFDKIGYYVVKGYEGAGEPSAEDEESLDKILKAFRAGTSSKP
ncbi:MAG: hypothetical protein L3J79_00660 [Candidatus Marinimicrobia bacterium]|nr:hypothetical protein [Candidatus Neomarinimicrobiota bacterium]